MVRLDHAIKLLTHSEIFHVTIGNRFPFGYDQLTRVCGYGARFMGLNTNTIPIFSKNWVHDIALTSKFRPVYKDSA
jgi:hypothetical protein